MDQDCGRPETQAVSRAKADASVECNWAGAGIEGRGVGFSLYRFGS